MLLNFGLVSGLGWLIDFCLFYALTLGGLPVVFANAIGATTAVVFVFFASVRRVFRYQGHYILPKLLAYGLYQACAIAAASSLIHGLTHWSNLHPVLAKVLVTPLTFYCNFQFMALLTTGKLRLR